MDKKFLRELSRFGKRINRTYSYVNRGGCCIVAAEFARPLKQIFPSTNIIVGSYKWEQAQDLEKVRKLIGSNSFRQWTKHGIDFTHVLLEFEFEGKMYQFDTCDGVVPRKDTTILDLRILDGHLTLSEAQDLAHSPVGWNEMFDRKQIPAIQKDIKEFFDRVVYNNMICV